MLIVEEVEFTYFVIHWALGEEVINGWKNVDPEIGSENEPTRTENMPCFCPGMSF